MNRWKEIFLESDIALATTLMGLGLLFWGGYAVAAHPEDFLTFYSPMQTLPALAWAVNYLGAGAAFVAVAYYRFPPTYSLMVGGYATLVWTWIAASRSYANPTSGVTLNFIVIIVGVILVQRSGRK